MGWARVGGVVMQQWDRSCRGWAGSSRGGVDHVG